MTKDKSEQSNDVPISVRYASVLAISPNAKTLGRGEGLTYRCECDLLNKV